jgi:YggT family protein
MIELLGFIRLLVHAYSYVVWAAVIMSWLINFNVINTHNPVVRSIWLTVTALTEPLLQPIRNAMPNFGALDISPIVLLLACIGVADFLIPYLMRTVA